MSVSIEIGLAAALRRMPQAGFRYRMPESYFATVGGNSAGQGSFFIWLQVVYNSPHNFTPFLHNSYLCKYVPSVKKYIYQESHAYIFLSVILFRGETYEVECHNTVRIVTGCVMLPICICI